MDGGKLVFSQVMDHLPQHTFRRCVARYRGDRKVKRFGCNEQYRCMAFGQLTFRDSLRDVETCLRAQSAKLYHMGIRAPVARNTLANANQVRDWRIYADFAQALIAIARRLYAEDAFGVDLAQTVYALDPPPSTSACRSSPGRTSRRPKARSSSTPCSTCAARSRASSISATASCTTPTCSTGCCPRPAPSTSSIAAISTLPASTASPARPPSS